MGATGYFRHTDRTDGLFGDSRNFCIATNSTMRLIYLPTYCASPNNAGRDQANSTHHQRALQATTRLCTCRIGAALATLMPFRSAAVRGSSRCTQSCELFCGETQW
jgi:hypothetical protein